MIIKDTEKRTYELTSTTLTTVGDVFHEQQLELKNLPLRNGRISVLLIPTSKGCIFNGGTIGYEVEYKAERGEIGCRRFGKATWAQIVKAAKAARKKKAKKR